MVLVNEKYEWQVSLLLQVLPFVARQECFALKGGTAINLFMRDMPRLSIDIDLTYVLTHGRDEAVKNIKNALTMIAQELKASSSNLRVKPVPSKRNDSITKLIVESNEAAIKIETNLVLRGAVYPMLTRELSKLAQNQYVTYAEINTLSMADLYGGKLCAALDRQHPRDLFDVKLLLENEGISDEIRKAFVVYLASHSRPMHELLVPNILDISSVFENQFLGMARIPVTIEALVEARRNLIKIIRSSLTSEERQFLLSIKNMSPDWKLIGLPGVAELPAIQWKLINLSKMSKEAHLQAVNKLREALDI